MADFGTFSPKYFHRRVAQCLKRYRSFEKIGLEFRPSGGCYIHPHTGIYGIPFAVHVVGTYLSSSFPNLHAIWAEKQERNLYFTFVFGFEQRTIFARRGGSMNGFRHRKVVFCCCHACLASARHGPPCFTLDDRVHI